MLPNTSLNYSSKKREKKNETPSTHEYKTANEKITKQKTKLVARMSIKCEQQNHKQKVKLLACKSINCTRLNYKQKNETPTPHEYTLLMVKEKQRRGVNQTDVI